MRSRPTTQRPYSPRNLPMEYHHGETKAVQESAGGKPAESEESAGRQAAAEALTAWVDAWIRRRLVVAVLAAAAGAGGQSVVANMNEQAGVQAELKMLAVQIARVEADVGELRADVRAWVLK